jgi:hypothetical protein
VKLERVLRPFHIKPPEVIEMRRLVGVSCGVAAVAAGLLVSVPSAVGTPETPVPNVKVETVTVDRGAQTVDLRLRICFSSGPRALIAVNERRALRGVVKASRSWSPRGVEPARVFPFSCRAGWRLNWLLEPRLRGPGTYQATIRVRDAYGRWTTPIAFSVTSP